MICKIADLFVEVPTAGGLAPRCVDYLCSKDISPDIVISPHMYRRARYEAGTDDELIAYLESSYVFYRALVKFNGFYLHSSAIVRDGKAYLFSGDPGAGKSTHTQLWINTFGGDTRIINDDKPALRCIDGVWYAYGTPWCGKDYININERAPVVGVCFMKKAPHNRIRRLSTIEATQRILPQTLRKFKDEEYLHQILAHLDDFLRKIPVFELENRPEPEAALLSYETMHKSAMEAGL